MKEIEQKQKLVWCVRMMDMVGLVEHNGRLSARIPGTDRVLIQSRFSSRAALTEKDILTVDLEGKLLEARMSLRAKHRSTLVLIVRART